MTNAKKSITVISRDGNVTREVGLADLKKYLAWGWKPADGGIPTFVLKPPRHQIGPTIIGDNIYPAIDESIDNRATTVISDPANYYDVERLIENGWEVIKYQ